MDSQVMKAIALSLDGNLNISMPSISIKVKGKAC
jgi:hypothetical protein